jgi:hypothetical protein
VCPRRPKAPQRQAGASRGSGPQMANAWAPRERWATAVDTVGSPQGRRAAGSSAGSVGGVEIDPGRHRSRRCVEDGQRVPGLLDDPASRRAAPVRAGSRAGRGHRRGAVDRSQSAPLRFMTERNRPVLHPPADDARRGRAVRVFVRSERLPLDQLQAVHARNDAGTLTAKIVLTPASRRSRGLIGPSSLAWAQPIAAPPPADTSATSSSQMPSRPVSQCTRFAVNKPQ